MAAFSPGNIVVYRIGAIGSTTALSSAPTATFIDEYTPTGTLVQSIALPTAQTTNGAGTTEDALTDSGTATSDGLISLSGNGQSLLVAGYNTAVGSTTSSDTGTTASATANQRVIGVVSASGTVDTSTNVATFGTGNNARSAASQDGSNLYISTPGGIGYTTDGSTTAPTAIDTTNTRQTEVTNGQLYYSTGSGTAGIYTLSTPPTASVGTTGDAGMMLAASPSPYGFFFANLGTTTQAQPDTLYVADSTNGVEKFVFNGTTYTAAGAITTVGGTSLLGTTSATQLSGITGTVAGGTATIYFTTGSGIYSFTDSGTGSLSNATSVTKIASASPNTVFRGDALAPQAAACFVEGTRIRTPRGDIAIESLAVGDVVVTAAGAHRPIRWIGHRTLDCALHPDPTAALPVRIAAHAFGAGRPARDLLVSPGHSICVTLDGEELLIPAIALTNDATIRQIDVERVTYWHVELDGHDVILSENLPSESYLDMGNRGFFVESNLTVLGAAPDAQAHTHADFCRPFHGDGQVVERVRADLFARAVASGYRLEDVPMMELQLEVDGRRVLPTVRGLSATFAVPSGAREVSLLSPTKRPFDIGQQDRRALGAMVFAVTARDGFGSEKVTSFADPLLGPGFHEIEPHGRWTSGRARIPAELWQKLTGDILLRIDLCTSLLPRWATPERAAVDAAVA